MRVQRVIVISTTLVTVALGLSSCADSSCGLGTLRVSPGTAVAGQAVDLANRGAQCGNDHPEPVSVTLFDAEHQTCTLRKNVSLDPRGHFAIAVTVPRNAAPGPAILNIDQQACDDAQSCAGARVDLRIVAGP